MIIPPKKANSSLIGQNEKTAIEAWSPFQGLERNILLGLCVFSVLWVSTFIHLIFSTVNISSLIFIPSFIGHTCHQNWALPNRTGGENSVCLSSAAEGTHCGPALSGADRAAPYCTFVHLLSVFLMKLAVSHYVTCMYRSPAFWIWISLWLFSASCGLCCSQWKYTAESFFFFNWVLTFEILTHIQCLKCWGI